jgi:hypothetical protein
MVYGERTKKRAVIVCDPNRPAGAIALPAPTPSDIRVHFRRSEMTAASVLNAPAQGPAPPGGPADRRAGGSPQPGGRASTENRYQLEALPSGATRLVLLFGPEGGGRGQRRRPGAVAGVGDGGGHRGRW